jgi:RNA recognition motif-containing protein
VPSGISGWVWIPAGSDLPRGGKDRGKGKDRSRGWDEGKGRGKDRGAKGKGRERGREAPPVKTKFKGKGKSTGPVKSEKQMETLKKIRSWDVAKKAWVGGLSKKTTWKTLKKHFEDSDLKPELVDVNERKGTAVVCFNEEDDVQTAVTALNGSELDEKTIEVDVWEKKPKEEKPEGEGEDGEKKPRRKRIKKPKFNIKNMLKGKSGKPTSKIAEKLKAIDSSLKVWVGGLKEGTTFKEISKHFEEQFAKPHLIDLLPKNCAVVTFKETDEVASAIAIVNNTELNGSNLEVDAWTKPERKERKMKVKKEKEEVKDED